MATDVFWHKEGTELVQLNDHDSCESHSDGMTYYLDMFNTTIADQSQILCIGVNDAGRCVQGIRLIVEGMFYLCIYMYSTSSDDSGIKITNSPVVQ